MKGNGNTIHSEVEDIFKSEEANAECPQCGCGLQVRKSEDDSEDILVKAMPKGGKSPSKKGKGPISTEMGNEAHPHRGPAKGVRTGVRGGKGPQGVERTPTTPGNQTTQKSDIGGGLFPLRKSAGLVEYTAAGGGRSFDQELSERIQKGTVGSGHIPLPNHNRVQEMRKSAPVAEERQVEGGESPTRDQALSGQYQGYDGAPINGDEGE